MKELLSFEKNTITSEENKLFNKNYKEFKKNLQLTQDKKKIVENLLNGRRYVRFNFNKIISKDGKELLIEIEKLSSTRTIPNFNKNSIYLPYIGRSEDIEDYIKEYSELNTCAIKDKTLTTIYIEVVQTLNNLKENKISTNTHKIRFRENKQRNEFKENYYFILNFIKENYPLTDENKNAFLLNFDFVLKTCTLKKIKNIDLFKDLDNIVYFEERIIDFHSEYPLNLIPLEKNNSFSMNNIDKTIEKIKIYKNMENF